MSKQLTAGLLLMLTNALLTTVLAARISGKVTDEHGQPLSYASILVKNTGRGSSANQAGEYVLQLAPGTYTLVCQYVGYTKTEQTITVGEADRQLDFRLSPLQTSMNEVIVKSGGEDPAYTIIRHAIAKRKEYREPLDSFTCEAYIKTLMKLRKLPKKVLGKKIAEDDKKEMGVDSTGKGIFYLSESLTRIAFRKPDHTKLEVLSGRESGSNGYGFNFPTFINFYENNVTVLTSQLSPRGYISPVADGALNFYRYKYLGSFWEDGKAINQIQVIPRRKYEPLFSGTINITENDWRIHSLELLLTKESQLELLDTLRIKQIQAPVNSQVWRTSNQVVYFTFNILGIDATGNFVNVYNKYDTQPQFPPRYFNKVVMLYDTAVNKKTRAYWDAIRPVPLEPEEIKDYFTKDSLYQDRKAREGTKAYIDSLRRKQGHVTLPKIFWDGFTRSDYNPKGAFSYTWQPLLKQLQYNTVEGLVLNAEATLHKAFGKRQQVSFTPHVRYGFSNGHLNAWGTLSFLARPKDSTSSSRGAWTVSGGKRVSQFNHANPISPLVNEIYTLLRRKNYLKLYENYFAQLQYTKRLENDLVITGSLLYEDRRPLENTSDYSIFKNSNQFTPNYPFEKIVTQFTPHQAVIAGILLQYKPGQRYIQYPGRKVAIGSKYPTLSLSYQKGISNMLGSDVNFDKWKFSVWDDINFKIPGQLFYRFSAGGFLNRHAVFIQDYQHFNGNQTLFASPYLNSFQLAPYYANSTTARFYGEGHIEHHFNGFLTNKIPLFRRLNWNLVAGSNAFYVNSSNNYVEVFGGLENIFKLLRVDVVGSYLNGKNGRLGVRLGFGGLLGGSFGRRN